MSDGAVHPVTARSAAARTSSPHPVALRVGLVLAAVLAVVAVPPAVDVGLDGTGWDVVVVLLAVVAPADAAVAALAVGAGVLPLLLACWLIARGRAQHRP